MVYRNHPPKHEDDEYCKPEPLRILAFCEMLISTDREMRAVARQIAVIVVTLVVILTLHPTAVSALPSASSSPVLRIAGAIAPLAGIAQRIGGGYVNTSTLFTQGVDPHGFQLTQDVVNTANAADLLILTGHFPWELALVNETGKPFVSLKDSSAMARYEDYGAVLTPMPGVETSNQTTQEEEYANPHGYWLLPRNAIAIANATRVALRTLNSTMSSAWDTNFNEFVADVEGFESVVAAQDMKYHFSSLHAIVVAAEESYVAQTFGIRCDAVLQVENVFISGGELLNVQEALRNGSIQLILGSDISRLETGGDFAVQLAQDYGVALVWWNTVSFSGFADYVAMMSYNLGVLLSALEHKPSSDSNNAISLVLIMISGLFATVAIIETAVLVLRAKRE
jgi:zinc/manganese transport system substrate-binding protein